MELTLDDNLELIVKKPVVRTKNISQIKETDINVNNAYDLLTYISGQVAKRKLTPELDSNVNKLRSFINKIDKIRNFKHRKAMLLIEKSSNVFDFYDFLKNGGKDDKSPIVRKSVIIRVSNNDINAISDLVQKSKDKSIVFNKQDFFTKFKMTDEHIPYFKEMIKGRFRMYEFELKGEKYIEFHDFFKTSEIAIKMGNDPRPNYYV